MKQLFGLVKYYIKYKYNIFALKKSFKIVNKIGRGKDGTIYLCKDKDNKLKVIKILSVYGKTYLDITREFIKKNIHSKHLYNVDIISDKFIIYPYEKLVPVKTNAKYFFRYLLNLCDLEIDLIRHGLCYWDFGFVNHCNYMEDCSGNIKLIDYGGNSFLLINSNKSFNIKEKRRNLIYANNYFLKLQFIFHIYYFGLGRRTKDLLPTISQNSNDSELKNYINFAQKEMNNSIYANVVNSAIQNNLLTELGWTALKATIEEVLSKDNFDLPQESAHIDNVKFSGKKEVQVRGYQNYNIIDNTITPLSVDAKPLWDTEPKFRLVDKALKMITEKEKIDSFLDIGSNLGLYVFLSKLKYNINNCHGIDYNQSYIEACQSISNNLAIQGCNFSNKKFSDINDRYDCVLAMGIIHHLFHRTEEFGSLKSILNSFSNLTERYLIIEFPSEKDVKAKKWTNIPGRSKIDEYSYRNFLNYSKLFFSKIEKVGSVNKTRTIYVLEK